VAELISLPPTNLFRERLVKQEQLDEALDTAFAK
jgi:hypothetical protein